jgi:hypothetical protein
MLADLLAPLSLVSFLGEYFTRRFVPVVPGPSDKFKDLFSWDVLNRSLEQHRFPAPHLPPARLRLVKAGETLKPDTYLNGDRVNASGLMKQLANGATLALNFCDEVHPPLQELARELERLLHANVHVNVYAGWRRDNGFDIHWDDQDTLILQIAGRKHWKVWPPTRPYPFKHDVVDTSLKTKPDGPPVWDHVLEQGGLLSIPRGWWHVAYPMDEPCMHLTVTIVNPNGIDMLHWLANRMKTSEAARMDLPVLASNEDRRAWLEAVHRDLTAAWTNDVLDRYLADLDGSANLRPSLCLPEVAAPPTPSIDRTTALQLALPRGLRFQMMNGTAQFSAAGIEWQTTGDLVPALNRFNDGLPHTAAELAPTGGAALTTMLAALVMKGVLRPPAR